MTMTVDEEHRQSISLKFVGNLGLGLGLLLLLLLTAWVVIGWPGGNDVSEAMRSAVRDERRSPVRLADLTRFEWDQLYLYSGYDFKEDICAELSLTWMECAQVPSDADHDGITRFVFLHRGRLVHSQEHSDFNGDIEPTPALPLTPDTAVFLVEQEDAFFNDYPRIVLRRVPPVDIR